MSKIEAYAFARKKHQGQKDDDGKDYFYSHILPVYQGVKCFTEDNDTLCAALLHDTVEDTQTTYSELVKEFGLHIADLVMEVTHDGTKDKGYYFPRLHTAEGILIKLCDRASNVSRMDAWSEGRKMHYLKRTKFWKSFEGEALPSGGYLEEQEKLARKKKIPDKESIITVRKV